jgi:hypothetical protein
MKTRYVLAAGALLIALIASLPTAASATKNGQRPRIVKNVGQIDGDDATRVTLRVVIDGPNAEVERFKAKNVLVQCDDGPSRIEAFTALKPITVGPKGGFGVKLDDVATGGVLRINGVVGEGGESTTGSLKTNKFPSGDQTCQSPKQTFTTNAIN